jgi:hypothetical protein
MCFSRVTTQCLGLKPYLDGPFVSHACKWMAMDGITNTAGSIEFFIRRRIKVVKFTLHQHLPAIDRQSGACSKAS